MPGQISLHVNRYVESRWGFRRINKTLGNAGKYQAGDGGYNIGSRCGIPGLARPAIGRLATPGRTAKFPNFAHSIVSYI